MQQVGLNGNVSNGGDTNEMHNREGPQLPPPPPSMSTTVSAPSSVQSGPSLSHEQVNYVTRVSLEIFTNLYNSIIEKLDIIAVASYNALYCCLIILGALGHLWNVL